MKGLVDAQRATRPRAVKTLLFLVAMTSVFSLLYGILYYAGAPLRLKVVSPFYSMDLSDDKATLAAGDQAGVAHLWAVPKRLTTRVGADFNVAKEVPWETRLLQGHTAPVLEVAFSADGSQLTSVSSDGLVLLWDLASGQQAGQMNVGPGPLVDVALSADQSVLATAGPGASLRVWDLQSGQSKSVTSQGGPWQAVALSDDGKLVAASDGPNPKVWDAHSGELLQTLQGYYEKPDTNEDFRGHSKAVTSLAFSPDGKTLASGSEDTTIAYWDLATGEVAAASEGHWAAVTAMLFDSQGRTLLTGGGDYKAHTFKFPGGKSTAIYEGHLGTIWAVSYGPTSETLLTAGDDGTLRMWESANQYMVHLEWSEYGLQPLWGKVLAVWMLVSGLLGLLCLWGLSRMRIWSHLLTLALYLLGPLVVLGLPILEVLSYPLQIAEKLQIAWPLLVLAAWYVLVLIVATREPVQLAYEAPASAALAEQLVTRQRTVRTRTGLYVLAVWIALFVILYSVLRRFNLDVAFMRHFLPFIMQGSWITLRVSALSIALAVVLALLGALGRLSKNPIANGVSGFYISLIRGTPLLVQIYIWYLGLPRLGIVLQGELAGILALGVNYGAYMTEIFRAGMQAIGKCQHEAAAALGMSRAQTLRRIVLPQAFRIVIPPIGNEFIAMMKDSSLVSVMSIWELTYRAQKLGRQNFRNMETFIIAAAFYWILTVVFQFLQGKLEDYMARSERR
jgi:polar amino acid transport system permease protein